MSSIPQSKTLDKSEVSRWLSMLYECSQVVELRIPEMNRHGKRTDAGFFNNTEKLLEAVEWHNGKAPAIYTTLNPVDPALIARYDNRVKDWARGLTTDNNILKRCWLPIDIDYDRPRGIQSSNAEHQATLDKAKEIMDWLDLHTWPRPLYASSGSGTHILYRVDLPPDDDLVARCLEALGFKFDCFPITIDQSTSSKAQVWKVYGTLVGKGDSIQERPHRLAHIYDAPETFEVVSRELLEDLARRVPPLPARQIKQTSSFDLNQWIDVNQVPVRQPKQWKDGQAWIFNDCPFSSEHDDGAYIVQFGNGAIAAGCHHNSCSHQDWQALKKIYNKPVSIQAKTPPEPIEERHTVLKPKITLADVSEVILDDPTFIDTWEALTLADAYKEREPIKYLVEGVLPEASIVMFYAPPGDFKSMLVMDMVAAILKGEGWLPPLPGKFGKPFEVIKGRVMWIDLDNGQRRTLDRFKAFGRARELPEDAPLKIYSLPTPTLNALELSSVIELARRINKHESDVAVLDTLIRVSGGAKENDAVMDTIMGHLRWLSERTSAGLVINHHAVKSENVYKRRGSRARGHGSIEAGVDKSFMIDRESNSDTIRVFTGKERGSPLPPFGAYFTYTHKEGTNDLETAKFFGVHIEEDETVAAIRVEIKKILSGGISLPVTTLRDKVKERLPKPGINAIRDMIDKMVFDGILREDGKGKGSYKYISLAGLTLTESPVNDSK